MVEKSKKPLIILAAGGTGGHVFPAESLATELMERGFKLALITDSRGEKIKTFSKKLRDYYFSRNLDITTFAKLSVSTALIVLHFKIP